MLPSVRNRAKFYEQLAVYLDSGTPIIGAITALSKTGPLSIRELCREILAGIEAKMSFANALAGCKPPVPRFEQAMLYSYEQTGRLPIGCRLVSRDLSRIADFKRMILVSCLYPAFIMHMAIVITPMLAYVFRGVMSGGVDWAGYVRTVILWLLALHGLFWGTWLVILTLKKQMGAGVSVERFFRMIPVAGSAWWSVVVFRFAQAYDSLLNAGAGVVYALEVSAAAANSAILRSKISKILPQIQQGEQVGSWLQQESVLGEPWEEYWITGEQSGRQEEMLQRIVKESSEKAERGFDILRMWVPKIIYIFALLFCAYQIIQAMRVYVQQLEEVMTW